jgi:hypothetical protein
MRKWEDEKMGRWSLRPLEVRFRLRSSIYDPDKSLEV